MSLNWRTLAIAAIPVCAAFAFQPKMPPRIVQSDIGGIELLGCEIDVRKKADIGLEKTKTIVGYEEEVSTNTTIFTIVPDSEVGVEVGGPRGEDLQAAVIDQRNILTFTYTADSNDFSVTYTKHGDTTPTHTYTSPGRGTFDPLGVLATPYLEDFGEKPSASGKRRVRVWLNYYGVETAFTLVDA